MFKPWNEEDHPCQEETYAVAKRKPVANQDLNPDLSDTSWCCVNK